MTATNGAAQKQETKTEATGGALATAPQQAQVPAAPYRAAPLVPTNLDEAWRLAQYLASSSLVPPHYQGNPQNVIAAVMMGADLGISAMQAMREIYVVEGRPSSAALLKVALVKQSPLCEEWQLLETTETKCTIRTKRRGDKQPTQHTYTLEDAKTAGLYPGKETSNWRRRPKLMLRRRCESELADEVYPDVTKGLQTEDEAQEQREIEVQGSHIFTATTAPTPPPATLPFAEEAVVKEKSSPPVAVETKEAPRETPPAATVTNGASDPVDVFLAELDQVDTSKGIDEMSKKAKTLVPAGHARRNEVGEAINKARARVKQ